MAKETEVRKCVLTGEVKPKEELLRFILLRDGTVLPDFNKKLDGHGFYISNSQKLLVELTVKNPLNKILHTKTLINEDLPQMVEQILRTAGLNAVNMARKSGDLIVGLEKVKDICRKGWKNKIVPFIPRENWQVYLDRLNLEFEVLEKANYLNMMLIT